MARDEESEEGEMVEEQGDDDDEANADLTLDIVAKAHRRKPAMAEIEQRGESHVKVRGKRKRRLEVEDNEQQVIVDENGRTFVVQGKGTSMSDPLVIFEQERDINVEEKGKPKELKKKKKSKRQRDENAEDGTAEVIVVDEPAVVEPEVVTTELTEASTQEESLAIRKLLRAPRYFDPPEDRELGQEACYNCGETGHFAAACTAERRPRPCYVCGETNHEGRACPQKLECFICGKFGHLAKGCPQKGVRNRFSLRVCLHCGDVGHEVSSCRKDYDPEDLQAVQCYVCKQYGHLCCVEGLDTFPSQASCYSCGGTGHTGMGCAKPRRPDADGKVPAAHCYKCGGEGHFARGCSQGKLQWPAPWDEADEDVFPRSSNKKYEKVNMYATKPSSSSKQPGVGSSSRKHDRRNWQQNGRGLSHR